jgi:hypothetical protein
VRNKVLAVGGDGGERAFGDGERQAAAIQADGGGERQAGLALERDAAAHAGDALRQGHRPALRRIPGGIAGGDAAHWSRCRRGSRRSRDRSIRRGRG